MKEKLNKEDHFIKQFIDSKYIGDDGAVVDKMVYSMDAFFENVHFKRAWMSLEQIAQKAMLVNISDAIVMNAKPQYALLSVAIPSEFSKEDLEELANGFNSIAKEFGIEIIGGDTISNEKLDISVTIISKTLNPVFRKGIQKDDLLCYTGDLGSVKKDLEKLLSGETILKDSKFIKPQLRPEFFYEISEYLTSAMDISDGLFFELERLSQLNQIGFEFLKEFSKEVACSGEEYEVLFSINKKDKETIEQIAKKHDVDLNFFAKAIKGSFTSPCKSHHFG